MIKDNRVTYSLGATFSGIPFWIGVLIIITGIIAFLQIEDLLTKYLATCVLGMLGITFLLSIQIITLDGIKQNSTLCFKIGPIKIKLGQTNLKGCDKIILELFTQNQTMNMKSISSTIRTRSYDIYAVGKTHKTLMVEITDYEKAKRFMIETSQVLNVSFEDNYQQRREQAKQTRNTRKKRR